MIWNSTIGMTFVDAIIVGIVIVSLHQYLRTRISVMSHQTFGRGGYLILSGFGLIGLFYLSDLLLMHLLPLFESQENILQMMTEMHLIYRGPVTVISMTAISVGFARSNKETALVLESLEYEVSVRRCVEEESRAKEAKYRLIMDSVPVGIAYIDKKERFEHANEGYLAMLGLCAKDLVGETVRSVIGEESYNRAGPYIKRSMAGEAVRYENSYRFDDGRFVSIVVNFVPHRLSDGRIAGSIGLIQDVTVRKEKEAALKESEARFRALFETIKIGMVVINKNGIIQIFNPAAEAIFGYNSDEVVGKNVSMLMPESLRKNHDQHIRSYLDTGEAKVIGIGREVVGLRKNNQEFQLQLDIGEMRTNDKSCFVGTVTDLTELQSLESQLRQSQKLEAVGQLTGGIAHDFNNLLAVIEGNLSLLKDDIDEGRDLSIEDLREFVEPAIRASKRGAMLTHRLLAFSRKQKLQPVALDINKVVEGMEDLLRRTLSSEIDLDFHLECSLWLAEADAAQLENVILNLVLNARDAMLEGGKLTINTGQVTLDRECARSRADAAMDDYVVLSVSDTGVGIDTKDLERVFEPFFTTKKQGKGTGLGLSMVYGFAKQSRGHVEIQSEPGAGTSVSLYLPRSLEKSEFIESSEAISVVACDETVLIVEDEETVRNMVVRTLTRVGYRVIEASNGRTALDQVERENSIDLILADVVLPGGMSGPEIVTAIRKIEPGIKALFMSGYNENATVSDCCINEHTHFVNKPFSPKYLVAKVQEALTSAA